MRNSFQINRIRKLESEINIAIDWFLKNEMIINPDKFQAIFLDRKKSNFGNIPLTLDNQTIKSFPSADLLGINLNDKLIFNLHVTNICRSAAKQLNVLIKFKTCLSFHSLVSIFSTAKSLNKIECLQKRAFRFLYNTYSISHEDLLEKAQ